MTELPRLSCVSVNSVIGEPPGAQALPFCTFSLFAATALYRTYTCRPSSRLQVVVEEEAPDCAAAQGTNNNDTSNALQTIMADIMESPPRRSVSPDSLYGEEF